MSPLIKSFVPSNIKVPLLNELKPIPFTRVAPIPLTNPLAVIPAP
jgi:hypothetical protein